MQCSKRRFPRIPVQRPGEVELARPLNGRVVRTRAPVFVRDLSPEGAGLTCESPCRVRIGEGVSLVIRLTLGDREVEIPGRVTWYRDKPGGAREFGARLLLHLALDDSRHAYADWVVARVQLLLADECEAAG